MLLEWNRSFFVQKKLESAAWFVDAIQQRKQTIQQVMESIIKHQAAYFDSGERSLKPMILRDIADDINMDISTISRVTSGKYVQLHEIQWRYHQTVL